MSSKSLAKQELVVESLRRGLAGGSAVQFIRESGYAISEAGVTRYVQSMGGAGRIQALMDEGKTNIEILEICSPAAPAAEPRATAPPDPPRPTAPQLTPLLRPEEAPVYETAKMTVHLPADVYEAVRLAARAEGKTQNQLIVELLQSALSRLPMVQPEQSDEPEEAPPTE